MKQTFKKYKKLIISFFILFVPLMTIAFFPLKYTLIAPGLTNDISEFMIIEDSYESEGSFHTTSVIVLNRTTLFQYFLAKFEKSVNVSPYPEIYDHLDIDDLEIRSYLMKDDSLHTSLIIAIEEAGVDLTYESNLTVYLTFDYLTEDTLEIGDKVISVNGNTDISSEMSTVNCLETAQFVVLRDNDELTYNLTKNKVTDTSCSFGISVYNYSEIIDTVVKYQIVDTNTGGPSGGLLQALYVYDQLTPFDWTYGLKIGGTGTINIDGRVGYIGGIEQKIYTAILNGIDIFFVPYLSDESYDNYVQALEIYNTFDTDMILVGVENFSDALLFLENYGGAN